MVNIDIQILSHVSFPRQWPRVTVGLFALWGLYGAISALVLGLRLNQSLLETEKLSHPFGELGPEEEDRVIKISLITAGVISILIHGIELFASLRKSILATKAALGLWIIQVGWLLLAAIVFFITILSMSDSDRQQLPKLSAWDWVKSVFSLALTFFNGWALLVFLRDLKLRPRNVWGRLVRTGGVFDYAPIGEGQVHI